ncbi:MAG: hypothetical protein ACTSXO_00920 [Candidatus Heimdallarchaeota archaeon]
MSLWPSICARCGESDNKKLTNQKYRWQQIIFQSQTQTTRYTRSVYVNVEGYLCMRCKKIALTRLIISLLLSMVGLSIGFAWTFGAFGGVNLLGLIVLVPSIFYFIFLVLLRRHYVRFYMHFYHSGGYIQGFFRSKKYKEAFSQSFPGGIYIRE